MDAIETERLLLAPIALEHLQALQAVIGDDPEMSWSGEPQPIQKTVQVLQRQLKHYEQNGFGVWAVFFKQTGEMIGDVGLKVTKNSSEVELVAFIAKRCWRQGIAFEACIGALRYGFSELELERIVANTRPCNAGAQKLLEKLGFCFVREDIAYNHEVYYYELLWQQFNPGGTVYVLHRDAK